MKNRYKPAFAAGLCAVLVATPVVCLAQTKATGRLPEYVQKALETHPAMVAAGARLRQAEALSNAASRPLYNPQLELDYEDTESTLGTLGLSQSFDWTNKRGARHAAAAAEAAAVRAETAATREAFIGELLAAIARQNTLLNLTELAEQRLALMQRFQAIAEQRQAAGDLPEVDLNLAVLAATQARFQRARVVSDLAGSRADLRALAAVDSSTIPAFPEQLPAVPALAFNPELLPSIVAGRSRTQAAEANLELARRQRRPDPMLAARAGRDEGEDLIGLTLTIPLFVRNNFSYEVVAAEASRAEADANLATETRLRTADMDRLHARYREMHAAWQEWMAAGQISLDRQTQTLEKLWRAGELATSEYLIQITQALSTNASATELQGELWLAWFDWLAASATGADWLGL